MKTDRPFVVKHSVRNSNKRNTKLFIYQNQVVDFEDSDGRFKSTYRHTHTYT